ncbi:hypothetical protein OXX80_002777 [Metschnikowia pulcherrima]
MSIDEKDNVVGMIDTVTDKLRVIELRRPEHKPAKYTGDPSYDKIMSALEEVRTELDTLKRDLEELCLRKGIHVNSCGKLSLSPNATSDADE